jgi:predicted component of type VI protein secretion system
VRTPAELHQRLHQLAGEWEWLASMTELATQLARTERRGATRALRHCVDELLAVLEGRDQ